MSDTGDVFVFKCVYMYWAQAKLIQSNVCLRFPYFKSDLNHLQ